MNRFAIAFEGDDDGAFEPPPVRPQPQRPRKPSEPTTLEAILGGKEKVRAFQYRERNREKLRALNAAYRAANPEKCRASAVASRAKKKAAQLAAREKNIEEINRSLRDPTAAVLLGIMPR